MTEHELKTWPESFAAVVFGKKTAEFRRNDRGFKVGDLLKLREYIPTPEEWEEQGRDLEDYSWPASRQGYTGEYLLARVTHVATDYGIPDDYVMLSIRSEVYGLG